MIDFSKASALLGVTMKTLFKKTMRRLSRSTRLTAVGIVLGVLVAFVIGAALYMLNLQHKLD
jgi:CDP-diglyceride synthetase